MTTITVSRELLEQAAEDWASAARLLPGYRDQHLLALKDRCHAHVRTIRAALAQQAEPPMTAYEAGQHVRKVFAAAPTPTEQEAREWTDAQVEAALSAWFTADTFNVLDHPARMRAALNAAMKEPT